MSDTTAAKILNDLNIIFSNDSLSVQERIYQLYLLLARYDKGGDNSIPETPKPVENATNAFSGAVEHPGGVAPIPSQKHLEEQQWEDSPQADDVVDEPTDTKTRATTGDTPADGKTPGVVQSSPDSVVYNESQILHDGQNREEEISVPVVGAEQTEASPSGVGTTAASTNKMAKTGVVMDGGIGEEHVKSAILAADGGYPVVAKPVSGPEADGKSCFESPDKISWAILNTNSSDSGLAAASINSGQSQPLEPVKKSKTKKIKEKLHIGKK